MFCIGFGAPFAIGDFVCIVSRCLLYLSCFPSLVAKEKKIHAVSRIHFSAISLTSFERWCARGATAVKKAYLMSVGLWPWTLVTDEGKTIKIHFGSKQSHTDASQATYFLHSSHSVTLFVNDFQLFGGNVKKVWISSNVFFEWLSFPLDIVV